jgi:hypothetical protein
LNFFIGWFAKICWYIEVLLEVGQHYRLIFGKNVNAFLRAPRALSNKYLLERKIFQTEIMEHSFCVEHTFHMQHTFCVQQTFHV